MQKELYQITDKVNSRKIAEFLSKDEQLLLPFLDLICNTEQAVDVLIDVVGKAAIESVLLLSARQIAGPKQPGKVKGRSCFRGSLQPKTNPGQRHPDGWASREWFGIGWAARLILSTCGRF